MAESVFEAVKQSITVREAAQMYGIEVNRSGMACCPFHDDKNPSMKLNEEYFYCFGCGATGDVIDFTARLYNLSPKEAAEKLAQDFGLAYDSQAPPRRRYVRQKTEAQKFKEDRDHAFRVLADYFHLLRKWETDYTPKTPEENPHPRFMEAIQKKDYVGYLLDFFLEDTPDEQRLWIAEHQSEIANLERRVKIMADKPTNRERLQEITAGIEQGIKELFESEKYMRYLSVMSKFHRYSVNNTMLIYMQRPDATLVAGFNKWKNQFERHVKKGEHGITIIAPTPYKKKIEEMKRDPDTHAPILDADGKAVMEEKEIEIPMFRPVKVFDVSQTDGKPLPELASSLSGTVPHYEAFLEAVRRSAPVPIEFEPMAENMDGYFSSEQQRIALREGMSEVQTISAAVHETAHSKLHDPKKYEAEPTWKIVMVSEGGTKHDFRQDFATEAEAEQAAAEEGWRFVDENRFEWRLEVEEDLTAVKQAAKNRNTEEVEAESISYAVCQYYGIETGENSFGYIATWSKGKELKELRASLETINKTASELITDIDRHFAEICKERGINREEVSATQTDEALYLVDGSVYLHVQHTDGGWDYSLYDKESKKLLDGGVIDSSAIEDSPVASVAGAVRTEVFAIQGMTPTKVTFADMKILEDLQEAQITPPLDSEQITGAVAVPTDAADNMLPELEQAVPMPDPTLTVDDMRSYGYLDSDMLPLSKDRALELLEHDITVYMLYPDNAEEMVFEAEDIIKHDGMFGVTRPDWDAVKGHIPPRDVEQRFLNSPTDAMAIYQLRRDAPVELRFANLGSLAAPPDPANYEAVYTREVYPDDDTGRILENFYYIFNDERPGDFVGHSLSVSDIVALKQDGKVSYHYCDSMGFQELPAFQKPENYLKAAEMSMEDDYGMIDGIINNGTKEPTVAELEQQARSGQPISLMELAAATHREEREKKKSVMEQLKGQPKTEHKKTAPKKSAEREI